MRARRTRRRSSSDLPENITPATTSIQPSCVPWCMGWVRLTRDQDNERGKCEERSQNRAPERDVVPKLRADGPWNVEPISGLDTKRQDLRTSIQRPHVDDRRHAVTDEPHAGWIGRPSLDAEVDLRAGSSRERQSVDECCRWENEVPAGSGDSARDIDVDVGYYLDNGIGVQSSVALLERNLSTTMGHSTGLIREQCPVW